MPLISIPPVQIEIDIPNLVALPHLKKNDKMKKTLTIIAILFSFSASAQLTDSTAISDSTISSYADSSVTIKVPVKAIALYAYYFSQNNSIWDNRLAPDKFKPLIGSGTKPDSLVYFTVTAKNLTNFAQNLQGERYGAIYNYARSVFENSPAITGYTPLITQLLTFGFSGTPTQKGVFSYINKYYGAYSTNLSSLITGYYNAGIYWIQH